MLGLARFKNEKYSLYLARYLALWYCTLYVVYKWHTGTQPSVVNICSLPMAYRSAVDFSTGTIGTNGTNRRVVYAQPLIVNICSLQIVYQSTNYFSIGIDLYQWYDW